MIVRNEADHLEKCLESVKEADAIYISDTGSEDNTIEIAKRYTPHVFQDPWQDDYAKARNFIRSKAETDYCLSIDADEYLEAGGIEKIREAIESGGKTYSVNMKGENSNNIHRLGRVFKNDGSVKWQGAIHETLTPKEENHIDVLITYGHSTAHQKDPERNLRILLKQVSDNPNSPREKYYLAREYYYRKDYIKAIWIWEEYVGQSNYLPEKADAYLYLARCYFFANKGDKARKMCSKAIELNPDFKEALLFMADLHYEPWKSKWKRLASVCENQDVLFIREPAKPTGRPLDMSEIDILAFKNVLASYKEVSVLEWGSGNSTKYFTEFLMKQGIKYSWESVEHDKGWFEAVKKWKLPNVEVCYAEKGSPEYFDRKGKYDVIFVDGRNRRKCLVKAQELLKEGGSVLLHDADREYYHSGFEGYNGRFLNPKGELPRLWQGKLTAYPQVIPRVIHFIWLGDKKRPDEWMDTWRAKNPSFEVKVWAEKEIDELGLKNRHVYDKYYEKGIFNGCANIARVEILERFGGVYLDADSVCEHTLEDASFMDWDIFSVYEADDFFVDGMRLIANGIIGAVPNHPIITAYREAQGNIEDVEPSWRKSGPLLWTKIMMQEYSVLPPYTFLPVHHSGKKNKIEGQVFAKQFWGTSKNLYQK